MLNVHKFLQTREQYLWWIRQIRADSSISLSPKNKRLRKIKGVTVSASSSSSSSSPSWKLHFLGANCFLAGCYLFTSEIYQRYFWFATARFLVLSLSFFLSLSVFPPTPSFHVTSRQLCRPHNRHILFALWGEGGIFVLSFDGRWLAVRARKYSTRFGCKRPISIEHSCQKVSTKIYSGVGRLRESCLFVLFACQWISSRVWRDFVPSPSTSLREQIIVHSIGKSWSKEKKEQEIIDGRRPRFERVVEQPVY